MGIILLEIGRSGSRCWYYEYKYHRLTGPSKIYFGIKYWHYKGEFIGCYSQKEFVRIVKLKALW